MTPNKDDMLQHLYYLHNRSDHGLIQIRCIKPLRKGAQSESFTLAHMSSAVLYADEMNRAGFNVYVCVNPIKSDTIGSASDADVDTSFVHFIDADSIINIGTDHQQASFIVHTGTIPHTRQHVYWIMDTSTTDMRGYRGVQGALAHRYGTDTTVINASRVARLAGSISYPDDVKRLRGYVTELTSFELLNEQPIGRAAFIADLPVIADPPAVFNKAEPRVYTQSSYVQDTEVPLEIIELLLNIIPPVNERYNRQRWLAVGYAVKSANPNAKHLFNRWQSQSILYRTDDDHVWDSLHNADGYALLFALAKEQNPYWFRASRLAEDWWMDRIAERTGSPAIADYKLARNMRHFKSKL